MSRWLVLSIVAVGLLLAGCFQPAGQLQAASIQTLAPLVRDANGTALGYAAVDLFEGSLAVGHLSTDPRGNLTLPAVAFDRARVWAAGYEARNATREELLAGIVLDATTGQTRADDITPGLRMLEDKDLGYDTDIPQPACVAERSCGLSEPVVEVAGDGSIYASATCCIGPSPPVWVSRDGGATFQRLTTPGVREAAGIEGDFAIDDAGNVYFTDILAGAGYFTSWDAKGSWRSTMPIPLKPLVDRPWVRAGAADTVYFLYNTGSTSDFLVSKDGGKTFGVPLISFPNGLGTLGQGPERNHLWVVEGMKLHESKDGGLTWSAGEDVPKPPNATDKEGSWNPFAVPVVDESGRILVTYDWGSPKTGYIVYGAVRSVDGSWNLTTVSPTTGTHHLPWPAAGNDGGFAVAWYGTDDDKAGPNTVKDDSVWYVNLAVTHDAGKSWQTVHADPNPVIKGKVNRKLLDFVQVDVMPDGAVCLVYAEARGGDTNAEHTHFVGTTRGLGLAPLAFPNGPHSSSHSPSLGLLGP